MWFVQALGGWGRAVPTKTRSRSRYDKTLSSMIIFGLNLCLRCCRQSAWNHHASFLRLAYKDLSSKLITATGFRHTYYASRLLSSCCAPKRNKGFLWGQPRLLPFQPELLTSCPTESQNNGNRLFSPIFLRAYTVIWREASLQYATPQPYSDANSWHKKNRL